ncbi:hypothetical protein KP509_14G068700 [Ceratopteris richardii]|uniref:SHSP domain-containing protein n=1 Tax=Ceratopteris richardii TaxID=49495 RepID=A0A8T2TAI3_CERRI|nr:hypothetical protein KP509_14G068700 [Ceratopteris richardii]
MAAFTGLRKLTSKLTTLRYAAHDHAISTRRFATAAVRVPDEASLHDGIKGQEREVSRRSRQGTISQRNRGWPDIAFPSLFAPQWNPTSLFLQPMSLMQMLDTADRVFPSMEATSTDGLRNRTPWDIVEEENCFKLRMDMPGINKNDVKLSVEDGELLVRAEHVVEEGEDDWSARSHGSYSGRIDLPETVDVGNIKAEMKDGVLKILAPKVEVVKQKHEVHVE